MAINIDFNSGATLAALGFTNINPQVTNTAGAGEDGSYALKVANTVANGLGSATYPVNFTKRRVIFSARWNRLWWTHSSGQNGPVAFVDFLTAGMSAFNNGTAAQFAELGWSNYPTTPATLTTFSNGVTANRTENALQGIASVAIFGSGNGSGFNRLLQSGMPSVSSGWHDLLAVLTFSSSWDSGLSIASTDGTLTMSVDGVTVFSYSGRIANPILAGVAAYSVRQIQMGPMGIFDDISMDEEDYDVIGVPDIGDGGSETIPTCCDKGGPPGGGDTGVNPDPVGTLPPWMASCTGGGLVDGVADLADGESWL